MPSRFRLITALLVTISCATSIHADEFHKYQPLGAQQVSAITSSETRTVIDLSGAWDIVDDGEVSGTMDLPSSRSDAGAFTIRRTVTIKKNTLTSRAWHILFLGVSDEVDLLVNGSHVMRYPGGSASFMARIPDQLLSPGSNTIELAVSEKGDLASLVSIFAPGAPSIHRGVVRELFLVGTPQVWTSDVSTTTVMGQGNRSASVIVSATINGNNVDRLAGRTTADEAMRQGQVAVSTEAVLIRKSDGAIAARSGVRNVSIERSRSERLKFDLSILNPDLWSPKNPNLYTLEVRTSYAGALVDVSSMALGLRSVRIETTENGRKFFLNDSLMYLHGIDYAEEYPESGSTLSYLQMEHDVALLKTLGVNIVRFSHQVPHPYLLHLCDRYGIMAMTELGVRGIPKDLLHIEEITALIQNRAKLLTGVVGSHSSIVACGLSDGLEEGTDATNTYHKTAAATLRAHSSILLYKVVSPTMIATTSEGGFDMIVVRLDDRRTADKMQEIINDAKRVVRTAALLITCGSLVSPGNTNGFSDPLSNESQAVAIRNGFDKARQNNLAGMIVETFNDHSLAFPTMLVDHSDPYVRTSGLVDVWRQPRVAYQMYKSLINAEKEPLLQARDFDDATPLVFITTGLMLALILTFIINRSRRFREYFLRAIVRPYNFYADIRDQRILSLLQTMLFGLVIATGVGLVFAAMMHYLRTDSTIEYLFHITLPSTSLNELVRYVAWQPALAVLIFGALVFSKLIVAAVLLRIGAIFIKGRILFRDTFTIVVWSAVPLLALLPIGIALYQILSTDAMTLWIPLVIAAASMWTIFRMLRATAIVFDVRPIKVYFVGFSALLIIGSIIVTFWAIQAEGFAFLQYYHSVIQA